MKKIVFIISAAFLLNSCVVSTAAKVVKGAVNVSYKAVKGTVNGISWAVSKAKGKIDEDRIDGTWKVVGVYRGSFEDFTKDQNPESNFATECTNDSFDQIIFNSRKSKFKPVHCSSDKEEWQKYAMEFGKNPITKEKENYIEYNSNNYISVIDVNNKTMVLEGNLMPKLAFSGAKLYLLEKVK
ncbi:hypothetical protein [Elizabethkingia anophelis]|uniref:Lipocalin-like domain-containing protein n=1 Tax=Elizabethkingia anophelis TaxID=1117645 RepID=X5L0A9_9FLAO|nr:hypothetical protein [Elizabethkingia anophelis]AQX50794.1 hypothetical protein AYC66_08935 [Elizabethkingia anophelis]AVF46591.1 hypothetical protein AL491_00205 [Elizabethkingia anophelis]AVF50582.1 hypothetical protein AL492_02615 [Elizabethkingia anophelis]ELB0067965.1 hypothetical protein [Elizabethkingia anophelis]ELB1892660.1 hypothetical protein [Elizabethkingia anophelis]